MKYFWKNLKRWLIVGALSGSLVLFGGIAAATGQLNVSATTNLTNGQKITVSGSGFVANSDGSVLECNSDASQPTVKVAGNPVPISCTNPLNQVVTTSKNGGLAATSFTIVTGTTGPAATGTDSSGGSAATDAANYPCPPTAAQIAAGDYCEIQFGDQGGDDLTQKITFAAGQSTTTTPPSPNTTSTTITPAAPVTTTTTPSTPAPNAATPAPAPTTVAATPTKTLTNTGPGNVIGLFVATIIVGTLVHHFYFARRRAASNLQ